MANRPCIGCGRLIPYGSRCPECQWRKDASYEPDRLRGRRWMRKRASVFRRAGYLCERCGRVASEVHHIDGDRGNNSMSNLLSVCGGCHRQLEAEKRAG